MKYHIITFGCQMNISDSERVASVLESIKYKKTSDITEADLIVVNMCSVRQSAVDRVHGLIPKFKKLKTNNRNLTTILTGCILKKDKKKFANGFDHIIELRDIKKLPQILKKSSLQNIHDREYFATNNYLDIIPKYSSKFSANVPIMTGCNNFCAYCVVPYTRDREVSRPAKGIISEIKNLVKKPASPSQSGNYKEIWLLGQNVNSYKNDAINCSCASDRSHKSNCKKEMNFPKLLKMVNDIPGDFWIRFTSSHPKDFSDELIKVMARGKKITPYLNLPVQSGDDKILKLMNRHYTVAQYKNIIKKLRKKIPNICLSTDIIVGFPGETKKQFENTAKLFRDIKYDMAYINKYSARAGTDATKLKDNISIAEKKRREREITEILKQTALKHNKKLLGKTTTVLIEEKKNDYWIGRNEQYKTIKVKSSKNLLGKFVKIKITEAMAWALKGKIINE